MSESKHLASPSDGEEILRILESSAAQGNIELIYTRRPDAYESYKRECEEAHVFVSKDKECTVGTCAELIREVYIGGEICKAAYICGLKKDAAYTGGVGFGARFIHSLQRDDVAYYYCSVVSDNTEAQMMFEKMKRIISMKPIATYKTYILTPKVKVKAMPHSYTFRQAKESDIPDLLTFLNAEGRKKDLFPVIRTLDQFCDLRDQDFYLLMDGDRIMAAGALWNQTAYKQYVVKRYRRWMRFARFLNPLLSLFGYIRLPRENEPLTFPMLSFLLSREDDEGLYRIFLNEIKRVISQSYGMFVIGLSKGHFARAVFDLLPSIHFETKLYEITFPWHEEPCASPDPEKLFPE